MFVGRVSVRESRSAPVFSATVPPAVPSDSGNTASGASGFGARTLAG